MQSRKIFVNYRRSDNRDFVERIRDWFVMRYGRESVFMDFDTIPPFTRFDDFIRDKVRECDVLVAVIGPRWLELLRERAHKPDEDYVRIEIRLALEEGKPIAPIIIKNAAIPDPDDMPDDIRAMFDYNVAYLDSGRTFLDNIQHIMDAVERQLTEIEGWKLVDADIAQQVGEPGADIIVAIDNFQKCADKGDWYTARDWLRHIRQSKYMPSFYPIEDYEQEVEAEIHKVEAERNYQIIRMMAERALRGREDPARVWQALQKFWQNLPGYDPDDIANYFRPAAQSMPEQDIPQVQEVLDESIFNRLDDVDMSAEDDLLGMDVLAGVSKTLAEQRPDTIDYEEALKLGVIEA